MCMRRDSASAARETCKNRNKIGKEKKINESARESELELMKVMVERSVQSDANNNDEKSMNEPMQPVY